jgi:hypothetical protein
MINTSMKRLPVGAVVLMLVTLSPVAPADDVTDAVNEALQFYKEGKYSEAASNLNYAAQLVQQKKGTSMESILPEPLSGWTAEEATSQTAGAAMFGGGVTVERNYAKESGGTVKIQVVTDSPLLQSMMMMMTNPMFATANGGKLETISGHKAIVKMNPGEQGGQIQLVIANRFLVTIGGNGVTKDDMVAYASAIDYQKMQSLP